MIVSHARKFIFVHNPKCAGTSFRTAIAKYHDDPEIFWDIKPNAFFQKNLDMAHLRLWELATLYPELMRKFDEYRSIVFMRNPYERFVSSVKEHYRFRPIGKLDDLEIAEQVKRVEALVERELVIGPVINAIAYVHFTPQSWFINLGDKRIVQHIIPMFSGKAFIETAASILELPPLPSERLNRSPLDGLAFLRSPKVIAFVKSFYKQDFDLIEKYDHLRGLGALPKGLEADFPTAHADLPPLKTDVGRAFAAD